LLFGATILFTFGGYVTRWVRTRAAQHPHASRLAVIGVVLLQLLVAVYIGFFGAGAGILVLALFAIMGMENIHTMNAYKTLLASCANGVAVVTFMIAGAVVCPHAILLIVGAALAGHVAAWYAPKLHERTVRR